MHQFKVLFLGLAGLALSTAISIPGNVDIQERTLITRQGTFIRYSGCFGSWFEWLSNPSAYNLTLARSGPDNGITTCSAACPTSSHFILWGPDCFCAPQITIDNTRHYIPELDSWEATEGDCWRYCANEPGVNCGGSLRAAFYARTDPPSVQNPGISPVAGFHWMGCYADAVPNRNLPRKYGDSPSMTPSQCAQLCPQSNFIGLEYGRECWCGPVLRYNYRTFLRLCPMTCEGDRSLLCGGSKHLTLYERDGAQPVPGSPVGGYDYAGCYTDLVNNTRALGSVFKTDDMTLDLCAERAAGSGAKYFGVEYGRECWTGNVLSSTSSAVWDDAECNYPCAANGGQACGARSRLSLYVKP
ncbi:WSC domain-containing protein [Cladorrhinum sp. PSN332]|nr:WSC domain-containing protein [Cladorrhinum sp. PSN332]